MKKEKYTVTGMTCSACSSRVEKAVSSLKGMEKASVNLAGFPSGRAVSAG